MKIVDTQFAHAISAGSPYQDTIIPFTWERSWNNINEKDFIIYTESGLNNIEDYRCNKILWILESPLMVHNAIKSFCDANWQKFQYILTHDDQLLEYPNSIIFPVGGCWIKPQDAKVYNKNNNFLL